MNLEKQIAKVWDCIQSHQNAIACRPPNPSNLHDQVVLSAWHDLASAIRELADVHWINCSEKRPTDGQRVRVTIDDGENQTEGEVIYSGAWPAISDDDISVGEYGISTDNSWDDLGINPERAIVTAWHALPAPYKGEEH